MLKWGPFVCPVCDEPFRYEPTPQSQLVLEEMELKLGRECQVAIDCPHCPARMLLIDRRTRKARKLDSVESTTMVRAGLIYDIKPAEEARNEVERLNQRGHELHPTNSRAAEKLFREALEIRKHDPSSWYNVGVCRIDAQDPNEAVECFRHALRFQPNMETAWNNLGSILLQLGQFGEAEAAFDSGVRINPRNPKFYLGKANVAASRRDPASQRRYLKLALECDPQYRPASTALRRLDGQE